MQGVFAAREKKIATDIDDAENARQEAAWHKNVKMSWRNAHLWGGSNYWWGQELVKHKNPKIVQKHMMELNAWKKKANQDIAQSRVEALAGVKGEIADLTVLLAEEVMKQNLDAKSAIWLDW